MNKEDVCEVNHISVGYKQRGTNIFVKGEYKSVLSDVSLHIQKGEVVGLVGESGCGKTTLAKCLIGLISPDTGSVEVKKCGMIFQDAFSALNPAKRIGWILEEVLRLQGMKERIKRKEIVLTMLHKVELEEALLERFPKELSGGQRQRVVIAMALLSNPEILIADEPVSALDVTVQKQIMELLLRLKAEEELSVLLISHDLRVVFALCDRVAVLKDGKIVESGVRDEVYFNPKNEYTKLLLKSAGIWE